MLFAVDDTALLHVDGSFVEDGEELLDGCGEGPRSIHLHLVVDELFDRDGSVCGVQVSDELKYGSSREPVGVGAECFNVYGGRS